MKLRNLMYAAMIACTFASCSNDDDPISGGDGEANATLDVQFAKAQSKALPSSKLEEDKISSLSLLVFNGTEDDALLEVVGTTVGKSNNPETSVKTPVKPGNKKVIILANVNLASVSPAVSVGTTTWGALKKAQLNFSGEQANLLTMNSKAYDVTVIASKTNYMGYGAGSNSDTENYISNATNIINLYRNVAKITVRSIGLSDKVDVKQYPEAAITLKEVFVLHGHAKTTVVGANGAEWGASNVPGSYLNSAENTTYAEWVTYMITSINGVVPTPVYQFIDTTPVPYAPEATYTQVLTGSSYAAGNGLKAFYTYENTEADKTAANYTTLLVVRADFSYTGANQQTVVEKDRYYPVAVGYSGTVDTDQIPFANLRLDLDGVLRNVQYSVGMTIKGPGYKTPFGPKPEGPDGPGPGGDTFLDSQVKVVDFGLVVQDEDIE